MAAAESTNEAPQAALAQLVRALHEPILLCDLQGRIIAANLAAAEVLGATVAAIESMNVADLAASSSSLLDHVTNRAALSLRARDGQRVAGDVTSIASMAVLLRLAGGSDGGTRTRVFLETLSRLYTTMSGNSATRQLEEICTTLLHEGMHSMGAVAGGIYLIDDSGENLELEASVGYPQSVIDRYRLVPLTAPIPLTDAVKRLAPILLSTTDDFHGRYPEFAAAHPESIRAGMACLPLELDGRAIGVLGMGVPLGRHFDENDKGFMRALALQCTHVVYRARQLDADRAQRAFSDRASSQLAVLYAFANTLARAITREEVVEGVVDTALTATVASASGLWLLSDDGEHASLAHNVGQTGPRPEQFDSVPLHHAPSLPIFDAMKQGAAIWLESCRQLQDRYPDAVQAFSRGGEVALACIPLLVEGRCTGGLVLIYDDARSFLEDERAFLQMIGSHAAQALERSRLLRAEQLARKEAETKKRRSEFLADSGMILASSLDYPSTLAAVARAAVPHVADWCIVELEEERQRGVPPVVAHVDPSKEALVLEVSRRFRALGVERGIPGVIRTGKPELYPMLTPAILRDASRVDPWLAETYIKLGLVSSMVVPISARGRVLGAILLNSANPARHYDESDLAMAVELGRRAGIAVDNARLYQEAREADRLKDEFLAILSHELRNPLAPIVTAVEMMELRDSDAFANERATISRNIHHVLRLINDLLDIARIRHGKITLHMTRAELLRVIAKAVEMTRPAITEAGHHLTITAPTTGMTVIGDEARLAQALANLLTNAAKYTERGGVISVHASLDGGMATIRVRDNGIGISAPFLPKVFEPFVQDDHARDHAHGGLGIGLTVVRSIVELHGGAVSVHSEGKGRGSEFEVRIPIAPAEVASTGPVGAALVAAAPRTAGKRLRVLVVDDNVDATEMLHEALDALGCVPLITHDGPAALEAAVEFEPDVAFVDLGMPVMDGYELVRRLRSLTAAGATKTKIIALTGFGQESDRVRVRDAGFDEHIVKPVMLSTLRELIQRYRA